MSRRAANRTHSGPRSSWHRHSCLCAPCIRSKYSPHGSVGRCCQRQSKVHRLPRLTRASPLLRWSRDAENRIDNSNRRPGEGRAFGLGRVQNASLLVPRFYSTMLSNRIRRNSLKTNGRRLRYPSMLPRSREARRALQRIFFARYRVFFRQVSPVRISTRQCFPSRFRCISFKTNDPRPFYSTIFRGVSKANPAIRPESPSRANIESRAVTSFRSQGGQPAPRSLPNEIAHKDNHDARKD